MVTGKPPRHSKSTTEPVTIDLDAKDVTAISEDKDAVSSEAMAQSVPEVPKDTAFNPAGASKENLKPVWDQPVKTPIEPQPNVQKSDETVGSESSAKTTSAPPLKSEAPKTSETKPEPPKPKPTPQASEAKPSSSTPATAKSDTAHRAGNSGLVAAGIVGGLIALLAAGSMQYAGYLPPFSSNSSSASELATLKTQVASLREQIANAPQATADTSALETRLAALESSTASSSGSDLAGKLTALESTVSTLQSEKSAQDTANAELIRRLTDAETKINEPRDDIEVARAIASAGLKAAIDRGGPFLTELDTLSRVTPDDPAIQSLRPFANTGIPSRSELTRNFPDVANAMLNSLNQTDPNQGIFDRLTESALSLVKVRPVGNVEGEGADAKIARMEDKLRNGDLKGATLEWDGLPEPAKAVSADFKKSLDARVQVEDLVNGTLTRAITSTGQQG
ncbi:COG4223 family protein [Agrobacterium sp. rho-13.3]|uniref:COG4223 family protein n=1 Tax=Agrobacterium sp. rho-13.3 TaxID=3072980 RepID=UPI002A1405A6|nr:COG4223 family protein [Agrobacterium sp. rho-13.3]MDX8311064.1 COG4223 family protein [Agrobacterium sp. rho-13.3]